MYNISILQAVDVKMTPSSITSKESELKGRNCLVTIILCLKSTDHLYGTKEIKWRQVVCYYHLCCMLLSCILKWFEFLKQNTKLLSKGKIPIFDDGMEDLIELMP